MEKHLSGRKLIALFLLTNLVYGMMLMISIPCVSEFSQGMDLLDMKPGGYDSIYVNSFFHVLGEQGREVYLCY